MLLYIYVINTLLKVRLAIQKAGILLGFLKSTENFAKIKMSLVDWFYNSLQKWIPEGNVV